MTREQEIIEMARSGMRSAEIAREMEIERQTVSTYLCQARKRGELVPYNRGNLEGPLHVRLSPTSMAAIKEEAEQRGVAVSALARDIISIVMRDGLVPAVLND